MHTINVNNPMKVSNIKRKLKHYISTMVICGSYMFEYGSHLSCFVINFGQYRFECGYYHLLRYYLSKFQSSMTIFYYTNFRI